MVGLRRKRSSNKKKDRRSRSAPGGEDDRGAGLSPPSWLFSASLAHRAWSEEGPKNISAPAEKGFPLLARRAYPTPTDDPAASAGSVPYAT